MEIVQQSNEWLELRHSFIGASDAPVIMGVSPWSTKYKLWQEKLKIIAPKIKTGAMQRGIEREERARQSFISRSGIQVQPKVVFHPEQPFMMASLDGISDIGQTLVEIKCPGEADHDCARRGHIPEKYYPQLQHQLAVCDLDEMLYYSFRNEDDDALVQVFRDDDYIKRMIREERDFWDCMNNFIAPQLTEKDYEIREDMAWQVTATTWRSINQQLKELEAKERELKEFLISQCQQKNSAGFGIKVAKIFRKGSINYTEIPELKGIDLEKHRKAPIEYWRVIEA